MAYPILFHVVVMQCLVSVFLPLKCLLPVFFPGDNQFYQEESLLLIRPCYHVQPLFCLNIVNWKLLRDVLRSVETFQTLAPFSGFILGFFCFLTGHSPSLRNWIIGSLAVTRCLFTLYNSMTTSNTL